MKDSRGPACRIIAQRKRARAGSVSFPAVTDLQIREMTQEEVRVFRQRAISEYAAEHIRAGDWNPEEAEQRSAQEIDGLLPDGAETAGMVLLLGETAGGAVGLVWVGPAPAGRPGWWIYDIEVFAAQRGRGHGRALLEAAEREARRRGAESIGLNMFGANDAARGLYESSGFEVAATYMRKRFGS